MTEHSGEELREEFEYFDDDDNGLIEFDEFRGLLEALGDAMQRDEARTGFDAIDTDGDGHIDFDEFLEWWES
jgi:Ca2+-binding EF-hand superfamily protein